MPREIAKANPRLRKREIAFAVAMGVLGAGGAALILDNADDGPRGDRDEAAMDQIAYPLSDFDKVAVEGPQDVDIVYGEAFSVSASGSADNLRQLEAVVENGGLVIRPRAGQFFGDWGDLDEVTFTVTMPRVSRVALAGSGDVTVDRVAGNSFDGVVGGSGTLQIGQIETDQASFTVNGSGDLDASGAVGNVTVNISGSGEFHADGLTGTTATVSIGGSGEADLTVLEEAAVSITGSGEVDIFGPGVCSVTRMGGGEVRCEGGGGDEVRDD